MAGVVETAIATWSGGTGYSRVDINEGGRDNNAGWVDINWWVGSRGTWPSVSGTWDWSRYGLAGNASGSVGAATGIRGIQSGTTRVYCDANGNYANYGIGMHWDMFYGQGDAVSTITPGRSAKAPSIANVSVTPGTIAVTTAQLRAETASLGWGTTGYWRMYYRKQGSSTWIDLGQQTDAAGYNYWNVTGLTPGTTYEFRAMAWNNNNDGLNSNYSSTSTFTTLPAPNISDALLSIVGVK